MLYSVKIQLKEDKPEMYYVLATILFNSRLRDIVVLIYVLITIFCISDFNGFYICICLQKRKKVIKLET